MGLASHLSDPAWLFHLGFPIRRFDVTLTQKGLIDDLSWVLDERYELPSISYLSTSSSPIGLRVAWHDRGLLFQFDAEHPDLSSLNAPKPSDPRYGRPMNCIHRIYINTRHAPGIQRATEYCMQIVCSGTCVTQENRDQSLRVIAAAVPRAKEHSPTMGRDLGCGALSWLNTESYRTKVFLPSVGLNGYQPLVFPEISLYFTTQHGYTGETRLARRFGVPVPENPSLWCYARLID
ncbi:hypothetical protein SH501x_005160 [Pirellulaceae bacterium SH501]